MHKSLLNQKEIDAIKHDFSNGIYISCKYNEYTLHNLKKWIYNNRIRIPKPINVSDAHSTVVYSKSNFAAPSVEGINNLLPRFSFFPKSFKILGKEEDEFKALTLILDAPFLEDLHYKFLSHGAAHDFDDYIPHVTISYGVTDDFNVNVLPLPNFVFKPTFLVVEPLNNEWSNVEDLVS